MATRLGPAGWSLATRLTALIVALLLPIQAVLLVGYLVRAQERRDTDIDDATTVGRAVAAVVEGFRRDLEGTTLAVAVLLGERPGSLGQEQTGRLLDALARQYPALRAIFLTDPAGRVIASQQGTGVGTDISTRPYILALQRGADQVWSDGLAGIQTGQTTIALARTVRSADGAARAFLVVAFQPRELISRLPLTLPQDSRVTLLDEQGRVLFLSDSPTDGSLPDFSAAPDVRAALGGQVVRLAGEPSPIDGSLQYGVTLPVDATGWVLRYTRPLAPLEARLREQFLREATAVALALLLAAAAAAAVARRLVRPLGKLARIASGIAVGERPAIEAAMLAGSVPEVQQLGQAMQTMEAAVAQREDALRLLAEAGARVAGSLDELQVLASVTQLAVGPGGVADWCVVLLAQPDGSVRPSAAARRDPAGQVVSEQLRRDEPSDPDERSALGEVLRGGEARLLAQVPDPLLERVAQDAEHLRLLQALRLTSGLWTPLVTREQTIGALGLFSAGRQLTEADLSLAQELARRTALAVDNARLYAEAQQAIRARDEFLSIAAHELRTPVTSIKGTAQLLQRRLVRGELEPSRLTQSFGVLNRTADHLTSLMEDLLDVSRLRTGQLPHDPRPLDLAALASDVVARAREQLDERHTLTLELPAEPLPVLADAARLEQVLSNLLDNAVKYSPRGGAIHVSVQPSDGGALVTVRDPGIGLPPGAEEQIFEPFGRAANATRGNLPGMGLGLYISRGIVRRHGGRLWAESPGEGAGTVFRVWLPASQPAAPVAGAPVADTAAAGAG